MISTSKNMESKVGSASQMEAAKILRSGNDNEDNAGRGLSPPAFFR